MKFVKCVIGVIATLSLYDVADAQHDLGVRGNGTGTAYDSIYIPVNHQDSLWLNMEDGDSLRIERYRGRTFVDSVTEIWSTNDLNPAGMTGGIWLKPLRASDGSGNTGQYTIFLTAWKNGAYDGTRARSLTYTYDVRPYNIYDSVNAILDTLQNHDNWVARADSVNAILDTLQLWDDEIAVIFNMRDSINAILDTLQLHDDWVAKQTNLLIVRDSVNAILDTLQLWDDDIALLIPLRDTINAILDTLQLHDNWVARADTVNAILDTLQLWDDDIALLIAMRDTINAIIDTLQNHDDWVMATAHHRVNNLILDDGFEMGTLGGTGLGWDVDNGSPTVVTTLPRGSGRYVLRLAQSTSDAVKSDTILLKQGQRIMWGADVWARGLSTAISLSTGGVDVATQNPTYGSAWEGLVDIYKVPSTARYLMKITAGASINDTSRWDNPFMILLDDTIQFDKSNYTLSLADKQILLDSIVAHMIDANNLVTNPSFEEGTANWTLTGAGGAANSVTGANDKHGRRHLQLVGGSVTTTFDSDTIQLSAGQHVSFGALVSGGSPSTRIFLIREGTGSPVKSITPSAAIFDGVWVYATDEIKVAVTDEYFLRFSVSAGATAEFDGSFVVPFIVNEGSSIMDTVFATNAAGGGGCSVGSQFVDTVVFRNTTTSSNIPNTGFMISNLSGTPLITSSTNSSGKIIITFDAGTYLIWPSFMAGINWTDRPDTFVVTGNGQSDTVRGVTASQLTPAVAGKTVVYGYVQDMLGDTVTLLDKVEVNLSYDYTGYVKCCTGDTLILMAPVGQATIFSSGRWEVNLYPTSKLIPNCKYRITVTVGDAVIGKRTFTVPDTGPAAVRF